MAHPQPPHTKNKKQTIWSYCRKSTDSEDKQVRSLGDQKELNQACYGTLPDVERQYRLQIVQEAKSAFKPGKRPVFRAMMEAIYRGEVYAVIVYHPNRISRNHQESGEFVQALVDGKLQFLITADGRRYTGSDSGAIFMLSLEGAASWKDSKDKGQGILRGMRSGAKAGTPMGPTAMGYKRFITPEGKRTKVIDPVIGPLVRQMFVLASTGAYSLGQLMKWAKPKLRSRRGKVMSKSAIQYILHDPTYKGIVRFEGVEHPGKHPPLVSPMLWQRVQTSLASRNQNTSRSKKLSLKELFRLGSLVRCGGCNHVLSPYRVRKPNGKEYVYYECKNTECKEKPCVRQGDLLAELQAKLSRLDLAADALDQMRTLMLQSHTERMEADTEGRRTIGEEYETAKAKIGQLLEQRADAQRMGCSDELDGQIERLRAERDELQGQLNSLHTDGSEWIAKTIKCFELLKIAQEILLYGSWGSREAMLRSLASNYVWRRGKLHWDLRSPFREAALSSERPNWWAILDLNQ